MTDKRKESGSGKLLYCSFCGKSQHEVRKLIAGPSVYICDECVDLCNDIIREEVQESNTDSAQEHLPVPQEQPARIEDVDSVVGRFAREACANQSLSDGPGDANAACSGAVVRG